MAIFAPLESRFLSVLDRILEFFSIEGHFVDFGVGSTDVAEHRVAAGRLSDAEANG